MTAREFLEKYPNGIVGEVRVDLSEFVTEHGLDAELPPFNGSDVVEVTQKNCVYKSGEKNE